MSVISCQVSSASPISALLKAIPPIFNALHRPGFVSEKKVEDQDYVLLHSQVLTTLKEEYGYLILPEFKAKVIHGGWELVPHLIEWVGARREGIYFQCS